MSFQNFQNSSKISLNDNIYPSQSWSSNQNYYSNPINMKSNFSMQTPKKNHTLSSNNAYNIENSFIKDNNYKGSSSSLKFECKHSSSNFINLINTPHFEKICQKIFFPQDDLFHFSTTKKTPNKKDIKNNNIQANILNENINKENIYNINNNINYNQSIKRNKNYSLNISFSKTNITRNKAYSISKSYSKKGRNKQSKNNYCKPNFLSDNNVDIDIVKLPIKRNSKFINELRGLFENGKMEICEENTFGSSTKAKSYNKSDTKKKYNKSKNKKIIKKHIKKYSKRSKKYNILTEEMKKKLLLDSKYMRTIEVAKKYGISTRNINRWKKIGIKRKRGSGRKYKDPNLEKKIIIWYNIQDKKNVTAKEFRNKALELTNNTSFRASSGWLTSIKKKYHLIFKKN